jgi:hypothetical protein
MFAVNLDHYIILSNLVLDVKNGTFLCSCITNKDCAALGYCDNSKSTLVGFL